MIKSLTIYAVITAIVFNVSAVNYCFSDMCYGHPHIACNNNGDFGVNCPPNKEIIEMTPKLRNAILYSHNSKRDILASGKLPNFQPAARMASMVWDTELAWLAELNVKTCLYEHDYCHNTERYLHSGQNLAKSWWMGDSPSDSDLIMSYIDSWWSEYNNTNMKLIEKFISSAGVYVEHFAVMAADKNNAVGCAAIKYQIRTMMNMNSLTFVCNYARNNMRGQEIYKVGPPASECTAGMDPSHPGLCSHLEKYDLNEF